ncbi:MAG: PIN domain-containing protein [Gammaproteobacteria bacterium]|nr:PIN domain-containing protein [Gammaproteobacteria bacterium]MXW44711.1 PIN domain-containing protein [Gammaproteobacteria bacterium]MYD01085.1 PIN domain-containing protein [Gammaproteobacteria bacterium]MYE48193.1 PIN domain-containing protein [Gammaproteobacteria bacterium]MYI23907.1 PIN domain-containing protein [Gammaproteobacteria bacterium]
MKVLFDTNVLIDFLLDRAPFADAATDLLSRADRGQIKGLVCATSMTTIFYLAQKALGKSEARRCVAALLSILDVAPVNRTTLERAAGSAVTDYEDAVVVEAARQANAACIVTRDERDFTKSPIPVHSPGALVEMLDQLSPD